MAQVYNPLTGPSYMTQNVSNSDFTPIDYSSMNPFSWASNGTAAPKVPTSTPGSMPSAPTGGGNFFSNLFGGIENGLGDAVNFIKNNAGAAWNETAAHNPLFQAQGAIRGMLGGLFDNHGNFVQPRSLGQTAELLGGGALGGYLSPHLGNTLYGNMKTGVAQHLPSGNSNVGNIVGAFSPTAGGIISHPAGAFNFAMDTATDPLSYTGGAELPTALKLSTLANKSGITPAAKFAFDWLRGAVKDPTIIDNLASNASKVAEQSSKMPKPPITTSPEEAAMINNWAGLGGGYVPKMEPVTVPFNHFAPGGEKLTFNNPNVVLKNLFNTAKEQGGLTPGREYETLQNLLGEISGKTGRSLDSVINNVDNFKSLPDLIKNAGERNAALERFGFSKADILPKSIRPAGGTLVPGMRTIMREVPTDAPDIFKAIVPYEGKIGQGASDTTSALGNAFTKAPYATTAWQSKVGAPVADFLKNLVPNGVKGVRGPLNFLHDNLGKMFVKYFGATPELAQALVDSENAHNADAYALTQAHKDFASKYQDLNTPQKLDELRKVLDLGATTSDPRVQQAADEWKQMLNNFTGTPDGRALGTKAELNTTDLRGNPILPELRDNYYPLRYNEQNPDAVEKIFSQQPDYGKLSTTGPFAKDRIFQNVEHAKAAGLSPEENPFKALFQRHLESSKALRNADMFKELEAKGLISTEAKPGYVEGSIPQLRGYYLKPEDNAAIKSFIEPWRAGGKVGTLLNLYDKGNSLWKKGFTYNPVFHTKNLNYNAYLANADFSNAPKIFEDIRSGNHNDMVNRALSAGAFSNPTSGALEHGFKTIDRALSGGKESTGTRLANTVKYMSHDALWDWDKALRTEIFRKAVESGASDVEAAAKARHFMVDYANQTPFEKNVMQRLMPFYAWKKGNIPLQAEQFVNNPLKQGLYFDLMNRISNYASGQNADERGRINTGVNLPDGSHVMLDLGAPVEDVPKLLHDGLGNTLWNSTNPIIKEATLQSLNKKYNPGGIFAAPGQQSMANIPIHASGTPGAMQDREAQLLDNAVPFLNGGLGKMLGLKGLIDSSLGQVSKQTPPATLPEMLAPFLGAYTSRDNPALDQYYQEKQQQTDYQNLYKYDLSHVIPIPAALKKAAYAKIPYPGQ